MHQPDTQLQLRLNKDLEWSGALVSSAGQGAKFALLLSMMQPDPLSRPTISASDSSPEAPPLPAEIRVSPYPEIPLQAESAHFARADMGARLFDSHPNDARLWNTMHPQPLSQYNNHKRIPDEVIANCDLYTQLSLSASTNAPVDIEVDETGLYDILNTLHGKTEDTQIVV